MLERFTYRVARVGRAKERAAAASARCNRFSVPADGMLDATPILECFGCLSMRPGWTLTACLQGNLDGDARVVALPAWFEPGSADDLRLPIADLLGDREELYGRYSSDDAIRVPLLSQPRFMKVVDGDGSPWSYLCASLAVRQLLDVAVFGRLLREHDWAEHRVVPTWGQCFPESGIGRRRASLNPGPAEVVSADSLVAVGFHTYRPPGALPEGLWHHVDRYTAGSYDPELSRTLVARGQPRRYSS